MTAASKSAPLLAVSGLRVNRRAAVAVDGVDLVVEPGEIVAVAGANGAGKTSLAQAIMGLLPVAGGEIRLDGRSLAGLSADARARLGIGYCPEGRRLFPGLTVAETLLVAAGEAGSGERARRLARVEALFPDLAPLRDTRAWRLSGGQQQMLAVGRALMLAPRLLMLDEPSLGLAPRLVEALLARLPEIARGGAGVLLFEQAAAAARRVAGRLVLLRDGRVVPGAGPDAAPVAPPEGRS